jgi:hydroxymethylbilane synthase
MLTSRGKPKVVRAGTRGSKLALAQAQTVINALREAHPGVAFEVVTVTTKGDVDSSAPVTAIGVGVWVKELETALAEGRIDLAVHSAKDLPSELAKGFAIASVLKREDPRDALISRHALGMAGLPRGARVATGSARRRALLLSERPDLQVEPLRGNVDTRLLKLRAEGGPDAIVLAAAGIARLGRLSEVSEILDPSVFVPAVGQGALALETRAGDRALTAIAASVEHRASRLAVEAERAFLHAAGGGCSAPVSAYAVVEGDQLVLIAFVSALDGSKMVRWREAGSAAMAQDIGRRAAFALLEMRGAEVQGRSEVTGTAGAGDD